MVDVRNARKWAVVGCIAAAVVAPACRCGTVDNTTSISDYACDQPVVDRPETGLDPQTELTVSDAAWDETAVRQVLHVFAFGGFASDAQVQAWADLPPAAAIQEILTLDTVNPKLSPPDPTFPVPLTHEGGSLHCLSRLFATNAPDNPVPERNREYYRVDSWGSPARVWWLAARLPGLNPVRQRIGLLETNYHMSVSHNGGVSNRQMITFYDGIMDRVMRGDAYQDVVAFAALSAAVAQQFHHFTSVYRDGKFQGNEDFGREFHQLYFAVLGAYDDTFTGERAGYHEGVTIPNTARALTGMQLGTGAEHNHEITYGQYDHWQGTLDILQTPIDGQDAQERITALAQVAIKEQESLAGLPVLLVRFLADDGLDPSSTDPDVQSRVAAVRGLWAGLEKKDLLDFLRRYAISTAFHNRGRVKSWTSVERNLLVANLVNMGSLESYRDEYAASWYASLEDVGVFVPAHDVFGGQTGLEARATQDVFRNAYNRSVDQAWSLSHVDAQEEHQVVWRKDWSRVLPRDAGGKVRVKATAEWLWQRFLADNLENLGTLERAHLYALLASGTDLAFWMDEENPTRVFTAADLETSTARAQVAGAEQALIRVDDADPAVVTTANYRVSLAVNFIASLPFMFAQQGR